MQLAWERLCELRVTSHRAGNPWRDATVLISGSTGELIERTGRVVSTWEDET